LSILFEKNKEELVVKFLKKDKIAFPKLDKNKFSTYSSSF